MTYILPNLLNALIKTRDDISEDDDEWNVVDASAFCLTQFALICKEDVVPQTIQFIETRLLLPIELQPLVLWNETEAALTAFGCILKGPCKHRTKPLVEQVQKSCSLLYVCVTNFLDVANCFIECTTYNGINTNSCFVDIITDNSRVDTDIGC